MLLLGARLWVLSNVSPTLAKKLVLGRRVCLRPLALALRLRPAGLVGELVLEQRLHFDVALVLFLLPVVVRELVVEGKPSRSMPTRSRMKAPGRDHSQQPA